MPHERQPLLAAHRRRSSAASEELAEAEDEALIGIRKSENPTQSRVAFWREIGLFLWAVLATAAVIVLAVVYQHQEVINRKHTPEGKVEGKRNLIFMVSDGMGPASLSMTRSFRQYIEGLPIDDILTLDKHLIGNSRTRSSSSLVTDSAAGATAFSCGLKSYNGAISILPDHTPCGTVLEAAKRAGYMTGLVVTTDITDATPACFASHVDLRIQEDEIALQEVGEGPLGRVVDLMLGGGRCHFLPNTTEGGCRADTIDVTKLAQEKYGWSYFNDRAGFDSLGGGKNVSFPLLGLFAPTDIPFEIDRRSMTDIYPSLDEMAHVAITALSEATKDSEKGFFLMIEGSRIDHGGHFNDPAAQVHEVLAYDKAFKSVTEFLNKSSTPGVLVATSDHETGGLAVARQLRPTYPDYKWLPSALAAAKHSSEYVTKALYAHIRASGGLKSASSGLSKYIKTHIIKDLGVRDVTAEEVQAVLDSIPLGTSLYVFSDIVSRRAQIGWSTHGHSAVDVNIYGTSGTEKLRGNHENVEVGIFLREYLGVDVKDITDELKQKLHRKAPAPSDEDLDVAERRFVGGEGLSEGIERGFAL